MTTTINITTKTQLTTEFTHFSIIFKIARAQRVPTPHEVKCSGNVPGPPRITQVPKITSYYSNQPRPVTTKNILNDAKKATQGLLKTGVKKRLTSHSPEHIFDTILRRNRKRFLSISE